jgi:uncharacterized membrane protein YcaP (DUF421 family)
MLDFNWIQSTPIPLLMVALSAAGIYVALMFCTRLAGLRSFSKMSSHDFAITVAIGSVIASTVVAPTPSLGNGIAALIALFVFQRILSSARLAFAYSPVENRPLLLMRDGRILDEHLARAQVTRQDLYAKLRTANVRRVSEVHAVIMEATGDVSVLHGRREQFDTSLLEGVDGA